MRGLLSATLIALAASAVSAEEPAPSWVEDARAGAGALGSQLQQALQAAMAEGGPVAGIEVCRVRAPEIADNVSSDSRRVGRTSLKVRNPDNRPDSWETRMLQEFEQRLADGEAPGQIDAFALRRKGERRFLHWMKAIPTQGLCTTCHGQDLQPDVAEAIDAAYPRDQARGYSVGDLRGAFSVEVELDSD
ncbi:Tll0287-like domain-containing protein [Wenzhouxiangella sp. EGI_FJ10409]|uniref:Tll0287-like domain-containing protein n=1 Tax=Wenzhouxiangella sp. EGI_FJ10409 TaxID=3243767 RepID=UPI0035DA99EE